MADGEIVFIDPYRAFFGSIVPNWLQRRTEISQGAKLCYARLIQYYGRSKDCRPKIRTLASELGVEVAQAKRYLKQLKQHGLLHAIRIGKGCSNRYKFPKHPWMDSDESGEAAESGVINDPTPKAKKASEVSSMIPPRIICDTSILSESRSESIFSGTDESGQKPNDASAKSVEVKGEGAVAEAGAAKATGKPKSKKPRKLTDEQLACQKGLMEHWQRLNEQRGRRIFWDGRLTKAIKEVRVATKNDLEHGKRFLDRYFSDNDRWFLSQNHALFLISGKLANWLDPIDTSATSVLKTKPASRHVSPLEIPREL